jgi:hypothetical protein
MLSVTNKHFMLNVIMLDVIMLDVIMLDVFMLGVVAPLYGYSKMHPRCYAIKPFTTVSYSVTYEASVFVTFSHYHPSLILASKAAVFPWSLLHSGKLLPFPQILDSDETD